LLCYGRLQVKEICEPAVEWVLFCYDIAKEVMLSAFAIAIWSTGPWTFSKVPPQFDPIVYFCGGSVEHMDNVEHFWESSFSRPMLNQFWAS